MRWSKRAYIPIVTYSTTDQIAYHHRMETVFSQIQLWLNWGIYGTHGQVIIITVSFYCPFGPSQSTTSLQWSDWCLFTANPLSHTFSVLVRLQSQVESPRIVFWVPSLQETWSIMSAMTEMVNVYWSSFEGFHLNTRQSISQSVCRTDKFCYVISISFLIVLCQEDPPRRLFSELANAYPFVYQLWLYDIDKAVANQIAHAKSSVLRTSKLKKGLIWL